MIILSVHEILKKKMESEFIVYFILSTVFIGLLGAAGFVWINMKDRSIEEKMYSEKTDPKSLMSKNKYVGAIEEDLIDPKETLKKFAVGGKKTSSTEDIRDSDSTKAHKEKSESKTPSIEDDSRFAPPNYKNRRTD